MNESQQKEDVAPAEALIGGATSDGTMAGTVLSVQRLSRDFGPTKALSNVTFSTSSGSVTAIIGDNGAGKSTLLRILSGHIRPTGGSVLAFGKLQVFRRPADALKVGIALVSQDDVICPDLSIVDNVVLGIEPVARLAGIPFVRKSASRILASNSLALLRDSFPPLSRLASGLSGGERKMVTIARALTHAPRLLLLDEPTNSLGSQQRRALFRVLRQLVAEGLTVMLVTHRLSEVREIADFVIALSDGTLVDHSASDELPDEALMRHLSGDAQ